MRRLFVMIGLLVAAGIGAVVLSASAGDDVDGLDPVANAPALAADQRPIAEGIQTLLRDLEVVPPSTPNSETWCAAARLTKAFGDEQATVISRDDDFEFGADDGKKVYREMAVCSDMRRHVVEALLAAKSISEPSKDCLARAIGERDVEAAYLEFFADNTKPVVKSVLVTGRLQDAYTGCLTIDELDIVLRRV